MIDNFVLALTHGLMLLAAWRMLSRRDLQDDSVPPQDANAPAPAFVRVPRRAESDRPGA